MHNWSQKSRPGSLGHWIVIDWHLIEVFPIHPSQSVGMNLVSAATISRSSKETRNLLQAHHFKSTLTNGSCQHKGSHWIGERTSNFEYISIFDGGRRIAPDNNIYNFYCIYLDCLSSNGYFCRLLTGGFWKFFTFHCATRLVLSLCLSHFCFATIEVENILL